MDDEKMRQIGRWIQQESWEAVFNSNMSSGMAEQFQNVVFEKLDNICPEEELKITKMEGKQTSLALQKLSWQRLREYTKQGNSAHFKEIKQKQKRRWLLEGQSQIEKAIEKAGGNGDGWMKQIKSLSARPGEEISSSFRLPSHIDENISLF